MSKQVRLLVVGSLVMDLTVTTGRFPNSGETVLGLRHDIAPGGKGANQALQAARLGAEVVMVGKVGGDVFGNSLLTSLKSAGVSTEHICVDASVSSAVGNVILEQRPKDQTCNRIIVVPGANMRLTFEDIAFLEREIANYDMVLLQLEIPMDINEAVAALAHRNGVPVMLNPAPSAPLPDSILRNVTFLSPNEHEAASLSGVNIRRGGDGRVNMHDVRATANALLGRGVKYVLITLGDQGCAYATQDCFFHIHPVENVEVLDPTAAGDSFIGAFCTGFSQGMTPEQAAFFGNCAAAITVSGRGAQPSLPEREVVDSLMEREQYRRLKNDAKRRKFQHA